MPMALYATRANLIRRMNMKSELNKHKIHVWAMKDLETLSKYKHDFGN